MPRQGQKFAFRDLNIEENALSSTKKGACFTLKGHILLRKKGTFHLEKRAQVPFWVLEIEKRALFLGGQVPPPPPRFRRPCD